MTTYELTFTPTFGNELLNLPRHVSKRVINKLEVLREDPVSAWGDAKKLKDNSLFRVRVEDYRIVYMLGRGWAYTASTTCVTTWVSYTSMNPKDSALRWRRAFPVSICYNLVKR